MMISFLRVRALPTSTKTSRLSPCLDLQAGRGDSFYFREEASAHWLSLPLMASPGHTAMRVHAFFASHLLSMLVAARAAFHSRCEN